MLGHFDVSSSLPSNTLKIELDDASSSPALSTPRDYLRIYYGDYLGASQANKPNFADPLEKTIDCDDWIEWIRNANPRTRVDAYPLLLVCKELLDRLVRRDLTLISHRNEELVRSLEQVQTELATKARELENLRLRLAEANACQVICAIVSVLHAAKPECCSGCLFSCLYPTENPSSSSANFDCLRLKRHLPSWNRQGPL